MSNLLKTAKSAGACCGEFLSYYYTCCIVEPCIHRDPAECRAAVRWACCPRRHESQGGGLAGAVLDGEQRQEDDPPPPYTLYASNREQYARHAQMVFEPQAPDVTRPRGPGEPPRDSEEEIRQQWHSLLPRSRTDRSLDPTDHHNSLAADSSRTEPSVQAPETCGTNTIGSPSSELCLSGQTSTVSEGVPDETPVATAESQLSRRSTERAM